MQGSGVQGRLESSEGVVKRLEGEGGVLRQGKLEGERGLLAQSKLEGEGGVLKQGELELRGLGDRQAGFGCWEGLPAEGLPPHPLLAAKWLKLAARGL